MKKTLLILMLALAMTLPLLSLAEATEVPEVETPDQQPVTPVGGQYGRRWNIQDDPAFAPARFMDENEDGVCDLCGNEPGKNTQAPGFVDEDQDGVCDHYGTDQQRQGRMGNRPMGRRCMRNMQPGMRRNAPGNGFAPNADDAPAGRPNFNNRNAAPGRNRW